jgi:hypothetical protein
MFDVIAADQHQLAFAVDRPALQDLDSAYCLLPAGAMPPTALAASKNAEAEMQYCERDDEDRGNSDRSYAERAAYQLHSFLPVRTTA